MPSVNGISFAGFNPSSTFLPIHSQIGTSSTYGDSPVSYDSSNALVNSASEFNLFIDSGIVGSYKLYNNAQGGFGFVPSGTGLKWGYYNSSPIFGPETFLDCQIINTPAANGYYGSSLAFRTQKYIVQMATGGDNTQTILSIKPHSFVDGEGGVTIFGGRANTFNSSYFNVIGDDTIAPFYKYDNTVAKFMGQMVGVVFPLVPTSNRDMMVTENGMVIFNSTDNKLQVYANGAWVNLH
jgi:hypothetical protein